MARYTTNLNLLKKNPATEGSDTFNITTMLNDNWDKIDSKIGNPAALWVWEKKEITSAPGYNLETAINWPTSGGNAAAAEVLTISTDVSVDMNGGLHHSGTITTLVINSSCSATAIQNAVRGKFVTSNLSGGWTFYGGMAYFPNNVTATFSSNSNPCASISKSQMVTGYGGTTRHIEYLTSPTSTTYPENSQSGDYWYTRLGQIGGCAHIETGSYVGTGTYESSSPNSLTFGFVPKIVLISFRYSGTRVNGVVALLFDLTVLTSTYSDQAYWYSLTLDSKYYAKLEDKTLTWFSSSASSQGNSSGTSYHYIAIG